LSFACLKIVLHQQGLSYFHNGLCAPVRPGSTFNTGTSPLVYESPWWAPSPVKSISYTAFCSRSGSAAVASDRTRLEWDGKDVLTLSSLRGSDGVSGSAFTKTFVIDNVAMATVSTSEISFWKKQKGAGWNTWWWPNSKMERLNGPWCQSAT
jgi:hypothetical protein